MTALRWYLDIIRSNETLQDIIICVFLLFIIIGFFTSYASVLRSQADEFDRLHNKHDESRKNK